MAMFSRGGLDLYYELHGVGEPLLLIAGLGSDSQSWQPIIADLAARFHVIAVARHNQARAWPITTPNLRAGYTKKQWNTSDALPVVPYPVWDMHHVNFSLEYANNDEIMLDVGVSSKPKLHLRALTFNLGLSPVGRGAHKRWLVNYWMPLYTPPIPIN